MIIRNVTGACIFISVLILRETAVPETFEASRRSNISLRDVQ